MRRVAGNLLIVLSLIGLIGLGIAVFSPESTAPATTLPPAIGAPLKQLVFGVPPSSQPSNAAPATIPRQPAQQPITRVAIPAIGLDAEVVEAALVAVDGGYTWQVPAFKVGHAESTAGAGEVGNAVLLGHVTSVHSGNVFADLDQVHLGDTIQVFSKEDELDYVVDSTRVIPRADSSVLQPTSTPSVSLITCTGLWLPTIWDYTERLVVHAELAQ